MQIRVDTYRKLVIHQMNLKHTLELQEIRIRIDDKQAAKRIRLQDNQVENQIRLEKSKSNHLILLENTKADTAIQMVNAECHNTIDIDNTRTHNYIQMNYADILILQEETKQHKLNLMKSIMESRCVWMRRTLTSWTLPKPTIEYKTLGRMYEWKR